MHLVSRRSFKGIQGMWVLFSYFSESNIYIWWVCGLVRIKEQKPERTRGWTTSSKFAIVVSLLVVSPHSIVNTIRKAYVFSWEFINKHAVPITKSKWRQSDFQSDFFLMLHHRFANATQVRFCKTRSLRRWKTDQITPTYLILWCALVLVHYTVNPLHKTTHWKCMPILTCQHWSEHVWS